MGRLGDLKMAIIKRASYIKTFNTVEEIENSTFTGINIIRNQEDDSLVIVDGNTGDKFNISDDNTLTFEEILERLDQEGVFLNNGTQIGLKLVPINLFTDIELERAGFFGYSLNSSAKLDILRDGVLSYVFPNNEVAELWGTFKIPDDYVVGSSINFTIDWMTTSNSTGNVIWGFEYTMANPSVNDILPPTELISVEDTPLNPEQYKTYRTKLSNEDVLVSPNIQPGNVVHIGFFRNATSDTNAQDIIFSSLNLEYTGKL